MSPKYRLVFRAKKWRVQQEMDKCLQGEGVPKWFDQGSWKFRFMGALHLLILRERARKRK